MKSLKTHNGDTLIAVEIPTDSSRFEICKVGRTSVFFYAVQYWVLLKISNGLIYDSEPKVEVLESLKVPDTRYDENFKEIKDDSLSILGTFSGSSIDFEHKVNIDWVEKTRIKESWNDRMTDVFINYNQTEKMIGKYCQHFQDSFISFLQAELGQEKRFLILRKK